MGPFMDLAVPSIWANMYSGVTCKGWLASSFVGMSAAESRYPGFREFSTGAETLKDQCFLSHMPFRAGVPQRTTYVFFYPLDRVSWVFLWVSSVLLVSADAAAPPLHRVFLKV